VPNKIRRFAPASARANRRFRHRYFTIAASFFFQVCGCGPLWPVFSGVQDRQSAACAHVFAAFASGMLLSGYRSWRLANGEVFHTYSMYGRGLEDLLGVYVILDRVPKGRDEAGLPHGIAWVRGISGCAAYVRYPDVDLQEEQIVDFGCGESSNNRMELMACAM
jgi:hypothetical protein